jgi:uncharacterized protein (TIGR03435 family)
MTKHGILLLAAALTVAPLWGQAADPALAAYDVASIKPNKTGSGNISINTSDTRYLATNVTLKMLMQGAWDLKTDELIQGLPGWASSSHFDIEAKIDADQLAAIKKLPRKEQDALQDHMMQALLEDRFGLKVHREQKELPIYRLVIAKSGSKLKEGDPKDPKAGSIMVNNRTMTVTGIGVDGLAESLSQRLHRVVVDETGLKGKYDFTLTWAPDESRGEAQDPTNTAPTFFTAVEEELGLKLESGKGPVSTVVVDHVALPVEN